MQFQNRLASIVSGSTIRIDGRDGIASGNVAAGATEDVTIAPPPGWIYRVRAMELYAAKIAAATTGTHAFALVSRAGITDYYILNGVSTYTRNVHFSKAHWKTANYRTQPPGMAAQGLALEALLATETEPIKVRYFNGTDAVQSFPRIILFTCERIAV